MIAIVGEVGINANGSVDLAKKIIDVAVREELTYVKFQKREIPLVYTKEELDTYRESPWGTTNREQKYGLEFTREDYEEIDCYCKKKGIGWFASPWDYVSVAFLKSFDVPYMKVPSPLITDYDYLNVIKATNIPVIISTGMSTKEEFDKALDVLGSNVEYILACTSTYPTPTDEINFNFIRTLKYEYGDKYKIGYSNHHPGILYCTIAAVLGCEMIEFHMTLDRALYGSDQASSIEQAGVHKIVDYIRDMEIARGDGEWHVFPGEEKIKKKLRKK